MFTFRSVFGPLKKKWQEISSSFTTETACPVTHANFFRLFTKSWSSLKPDYLVNGFRVTGIYPFNPSAIPNEAYLPSQLYADLFQRMKVISSFMPKSPISLPMRLKHLRTWGLLSRMWRYQHCSQQWRAPMANVLLISLWLPLNAP